MVSRVQCTYESDLPCQLLAALAVTILGSGAATGGQTGHNTDPPPSRKHCVTVTITGPCQTWPEYKNFEVSEISLQI